MDRTAQETLNALPGIDSRRKKGKKRRKKEQRLGLPPFLLFSLTLPQEKGGKGGKRETNGDTQVWGKVWRRGIMVILSSWGDSYLEIA